MADKKKISDFAYKWILIFQNPMTKESEVNQNFPKKCFSRFSDKGRRTSIRRAGSKRSVGGYICALRRAYPNFRYREIRNDTFFHVEAFKSMDKRRSLNSLQPPLVYYSIRTNGNAMFKYWHESISF